MVAVSCRLIPTSHGTEELRVVTINFEVFKRAAIWRKIGLRFGEVLAV